MLSCGAGILAAGILRLTKVKQKVTAVIQIVFGAITLLFGFMCNMDYDWAYVGVAAGASLLIVGILEFLRRSWKAVGIVGIVLGSILLLLGFVCAGFDWGLTAFAAGAPTLVAGILKVVNARHVGNANR